ncbi:hypothetical protein [Clostridium beijerinckii]|uniref:Uncharacterized protein n=2 Tax=Clostridium beijerinckii TaxID=1520 RepID=A0AAE2RUT8_CLOBE|nr:hypothetical protein [Clostridium beijerinckii]ABR33551.1 hypothetical protein Cbei_1371 [Clostridium beijerinckii NCIMB 8052]AIU04865.1 hypothetical protein Cbs_1371 [Clostridium beijerinckii ATCC 35702]MBF7811967.1 hypothetical protein [Clostridium beijerinckii]NRT25182.1 hypothetical protein [Clostridium beijerinckii]NRT67224.1 hypothetical protein [Clostridium beijerinckii]
MNDTLKNIITSLGTSLIVSSVTFTLGLKSGKNQSDRQILRNKYRDISVHFSNLLDGINSTRPKKWADFKIIRNASRQESYPLMKEMRFDGQSIELKQKIVSTSEDLELRLMRYSDKYSKKLKIIQEYTISELENHCSNLIKHENYEICTTKDSNNKRYREYNYGIFIIGDELKNAIQDLKEDNIQGIRFTINIEYNKIQTLSIFKNTLDDILIEEFLDNIKKYSEANQNIIDLLQERENLIIETKNLIKDINKRVKEPITFIETIVGAITDIFKV